MRERPVRIRAIRVATVPISRYSDPRIPSGNLTTSIVAVITDVLRHGAPVIGYGFSSFGRFAQSGLIRERFAPRLMRAREPELTDETGENLDPVRAWNLMMTGEKPGGHGERCVAVGTLDMALWDATAKIAGLPLFRLLAQREGVNMPDSPRVRVCAGGGYLYPQDDIARLTDEIDQLRALGYEQVKIKISQTSLSRDLQRIDAVLEQFSGPDQVAVDAMNVYDSVASLEVARALAPRRLRWFEDICDPLDFDTHATVARFYQSPIAAGEALFSAAEAKLLDQHAGLRRDRDILVFDPVHCYGLPGFSTIVKLLVSRGWPRSAFWPHGGHLFSLHVAAALGLGGAEANPLSFQPLGGYGDVTAVRNGFARPPEIPGIGFESKAELWVLLKGLLPPHKYRVNRRG
jgi:D(-)-tartrate dehydratase